MHRITIALITLAFIFPISTMASPPTLMKRNFDINFSIDNTHEKMGDIISIKWSFVLNHEEDSLSKVVFEQYDTTRIAKAYLHTAGSLEYISGDTLWWGIVDYDKNYSFTTSYRISGNDLIAIRPYVETHFELYKRSLKTRNSIKGCVFDFRLPAKPKRGITVTENGDTIIDEVSN